MHAFVEDHFKLAAVIREGEPGLERHCGGRNHVAPAQFDWIDSGRAIAARVATLLADAGAEPAGRSGGGVAWFTEDEPSVVALGPSLVRFGLVKLRADLMSPLPEREG